MIENLVTGDEPSDALAQHCWDRRCAILDKARLSALYHLACERHHDRVDKSLSVLTAISATFAVGVLLKHMGEEWELTVSGVTAALALFAIIWAPGVAARKHGRMASDYRNIVVSAERAGEHWTVLQCNDFAARVAEVEVDEAMPLPVVVAVCENQLAILRGTHETPIRLRFYERWLMHWVAFDIEAIKVRSAPATRA